MHTATSEGTAGRQRRRKHTDAFKAVVVAECARPGVSIARVALSHGVNGFSIFPTGGSLNFPTRLGTAVVV